MSPIDDEDEVISIHLVQVHRAGKWHSYDWRHSDIEASALAAQLRREGHDVRVQERAAPTKR